MSHRKTNRGKKVAWKLEDKGGKKSQQFFPSKLLRKKRSMKLKYENMTVDVKNETIRSQASDFGQGL